MSLLELRVEEGIAYLSLSAPPRNQMNAAFFRAFGEIVRFKLPDLNVRGMVVQGKERHFSSGADVDELKDLVGRSSSFDDVRFLRENVTDFLFFEHLPYPSVAAVNGCCLGAGLELALACTHRIATRRAVFSLPETTFGIMPGCGGTIRLTELVGAKHAAAMILSGDTMLAEDALDMGLIDEIVDRKELLAAAVQRIDCSTGSGAYR